MRLKELPHHGFSHHPYFRRWSSIVQRCYNPNSNAYTAYGARGITLEFVWNPCNPDGVKNFLTWVDYEVAIYLFLHPQHKKHKLEVGRKDVMKNFAPTNCEIRVLGDSTHFRRTGALTFDIVVEMRQYKRRNPEATLTEMAHLYGQSIENISRAIRGITWAIVNSTEPPLERFGAVKAYSTSTHALQLTRQQQLYQQL